VIIGIVNYEYAPVTYEREVWLEGELLDHESIELRYNETWEDPFVFRATKKGDDQKLEFILFKNHTESENKVEDMKEPYRSLHLWVNVKKPNN
jgi:uncharacterized membrane protein